MSRAPVDAKDNRVQILSMNENIPEVRHNASASRYECAMPGVAALAVAEYALDSGAGEARMILTHTFVPPEMRGKGVAEALVRAALADARSQGRRVVPECSYVAKFIERHAAEYGDLLV